MARIAWLLPVQRAICCAITGANSSTLMPRYARNINSPSDRQIPNTASAVIASPPCLIRRSSRSAFAVAPAHCGPGVYGDLGVVWRPERAPEEADTTPSWAILLYTVARDST